jgi:hypothetical protein
VLRFPNFLCENSSFFFVNVKSTYVHEVNRWPAMDCGLKSKWPPGKERTDYAIGFLSCLFIYYYWYSVLWILKLSTLKCFWYITCVSVEPYSLSTNVLKSLNVCDLGPSVCIHTHTTGWFQKAFEWKLNNCNKVATITSPTMRAWVRYKLSYIYCMKFEAK